MRLVGFNASDEVLVADSTHITRLQGGLVMYSGTPAVVAGELNLANDKFIRGRVSSGASVAPLIGLNASNEVVMGSAGNSNRLLGGLKFGSGTSPSSGQINGEHANFDIQGEKFAGGGTALMSWGAAANDQLVMGDSSGVDSIAMAAATDINWFINAGFVLRATDGGLGFHTAAPVTIATITGSRGANVALADMLTKMATKGLFIDGTVV